MGTWGTGPFDSDHVSDDVMEFERKRTAASGLKLIEAMFSSRADWTQSVAGAELINMIREHGGFRDGGQLDGFYDWVERTRPTVPAALLERARERLAQIVRDPEIVRQWAGASGKSWLKTTQGILRRLRLKH